MDTITHGIAGALLGKSLFGGRDLFSPPSLSKQRIVTWSLMLGAIFPDSDVLRELISKNDLLMITWHRSITHSLVCLPIWTGLLAALTLAVARWRKWPAPSFLTLCGLWAVGILSHIFLDLVTTYGTMIWSPLAPSRPAWDLIFIVDFTLTAIFLIPQLLAWTNEDPAHLSRRAILMWLVFTPAPFLIAKIAQMVGAPISNAAIVSSTALFAILFLLPAVCGWGSRVRYASWNRAGLALSCAYILAALFAHRVALARIERFVARENIQAQAIGALPLPPSLWHWDGLVRAPRGVYELRMDLSEGFLRNIAGHSIAAEPDPIEHSYFPDTFSNGYIDRARQLPEVQKVLWFQRFRLTRSHPEGSDVIVEFSDLRFPQIRPDRPASFTYRVRFSEDGTVLSQGWVKK
jgi:membrane-bound metal-dependent hydrolase YbcI (DUF457 family)